MAIPVSVIILTRNEEARIEHCLGALKEFSEVVVLDSNSTDRTGGVAKKAEARLVPFHWRNKYPKKKQWALDNLDLVQDWVLLLDADEVLTAELTGEIRDLFTHGPPSCAGYFIKGRYRMGGKQLRFGACNRKLALFDRRKLAFPVVNDLDLPMGEIEGHYQPVLKPDLSGEKIGKLSAFLLHDAGEEKDWRMKHIRYAQWERGMNERDGWPKDPLWWRQILKEVFRKAPGRPLVAFLHCYILKLGLLDGRAGWDFACRRYAYYRMIEKGC